MYRFYCADADFKKPSVIINDSHEIHHIKDVLRFKKGSAIQIFNAQSQQADAVIEQINESVDPSAYCKRLNRKKEGGSPRSF